MAVIQPGGYDQVETADGASLVSLQIPNESGDPLVPVRMRSMTLDDLGAQIGGGGGNKIYAPLVNGDLPGPVAVAGSEGQFIMVEITQ